MHAARRALAARSGGLLLAHIVCSRVTNALTFSASNLRKIAMKLQIKKSREKLEGKVMVPALLWMAGMPFGLVFLLWLFFFRGK
jgi:hypothetical protein